MLAYRNYPFILESFGNLVRDHDRDMVILFSFVIYLLKLFSVRDEVHVQFLTAI